MESFERSLSKKVGMWCGVLPNELKMMTIDVTSKQNVDKRKPIKKTWFLSPMQVINHWQWWSNSITHLLHKRQCLTFSWG